MNNSEQIIKTLDRINRETKTEIEEDIIDDIGSLLERGGIAYSAMVISDLYEHWLKTSPDANDKMKRVNMSENVKPLIDFFDPVLIQPGISDFF